VLSASLATRYYRRRRAWTDGRLSMTHGLVERMIGHRTRLAQQAPERWHEGEDEELEGYTVRSEEMDRSLVRLTSWVTRGWLVAGIAGVAPAIVASSGDVVSIAIALGGVLLAHRALAKLVSSVSGLIGLGTAWERVSLLFKAASRGDRASTPALALALRAGLTAVRKDERVLEASNLVFRYGDRAEPALRECSVTVHHGERVLLEGASGGGKSTLASLLAGLRKPESGLILLRGLDLQTVGADAWRRRVSIAPQFHENHVFTGTFAFNLLMGRRWPATDTDLAEAEELCQELDLGRLLDRMPSRMQQMVGDTGWQLSHGERSRVFLARALLANPDLVILDESFAALDPETLRRCLQCVLDRAKSVVVIAHP
jgi:ATP-binding cassette subfamily B protein